MHMFMYRNISQLLCSLKRPRNSDSVSSTNHPWYPKYDLTVAGKTSAHIYIHIIKVYTFMHIHTRIFNICMFITSYIANLLFLDIYSISSSLQFYVILQQTIYTLIISLVQIPVSGITEPEGGNLSKPQINIVKSPLERLEQVTHQAAVQECTCFIP